MKRKPYPFDLIQWIDSLASSIDSIRFWRSSPEARRIWRDDERAKRVANNVECARIAWGILNRTVARLIHSSF
jgi:hypothetical protein